MPLLSRTKTPQSQSQSSSPGSPTLAGSSATSTTSASPANSTERQGCLAREVCNSPLFGLRRQLTTMTATTQTSPTPLGAQADGQTTTANSEFSSIPQQITRQQIHYAFTMIDSNQDGMIDLKDLSQMLANLGLPIDEAVLSHVILSVSKRGDRRISELEFLEWISHLIQVGADRPAGVAAVAAALASPSASASASRARSRSSLGASKPAERATRQRSQSPSLVSSSQLSAAHPTASEVGSATRGQRRGSGSGLALMRSLSGGLASAPDRAESAATSSADRPRADKTAGKQQSLKRQQQQQASQPTEDDDARNDLKAAFCVFDLDGDGFITLDEVRAGLKLLGESWSPSELRHLFASCTSRSLAGSAGGQSADLDRQQRISIDDFVQLLL